MATCYVHNKCFSKPITYTKRFWPNEQANRKIYNTQKK